MATKLFLITTLAFMLIKTKCALQQQVEDELILNIAHYKMPCTGEGTQWCYLVNYNGGNQEFFYDDIEDFTYHWGYHYTIAVEKVKTENPLADASSFHYKLKRIIKKEKASEKESFQLPLKLNGVTLISNKENGCYYFKDMEIDTGVFSCSEIIKAAAGIFVHSQNGKAFKLIKLL